MGSPLHIGTGNIGTITAGLFKGFAGKLACYDVRENPEMKAMGARYQPLDEVFG